MVDNLITFASFLNEQVELRLETIDFRDILKNALLPLRSMAEDRAVKFHVEIIGGLGIATEKLKHLAQS